MLVIEDLHFDYNGLNILDGVNIKAHRGDLIGIVGPNGSGKTTLFKLISGVLKPTSGKIIACETNMSAMNPKEKARLVSVVPQNSTLPPNYTVRDLVLMSRTPHLKLLQQESRLDLEIAEHSMVLTEIDHLSERRVGTLSGGERQRAMLAMALTQQTPVLLMDEPTASFDLGYQIGFYRLIKLLKTREVAVLLAMHDLSLAAQCCDRIIILFKGGIYAEGTPKEVLTEEILSDVYNTSIKVMYHPDSDSPVVVSTDRTN